MKRIIRLTESDLSRIVKSVLNERRVSASDLIQDMTVRDIMELVNSFCNRQVSVKEVKEKIEYMFRPSGGRMNENYENSLYSDIMEIIRNSNSSHEENLSVLKDVMKDMESSKRVRRGVESRFRNN